MSFGKSELSSFSPKICGKDLFMKLFQHRRVDFDEGFFFAFKSSNDGDFLIFAPN